MKPRNFPGRKLLRRHAVLLRLRNAPPSYGIKDGFIDEPPRTPRIIKDIRYRCGRKKRDSNGELK